jgi:UTP--glucose-1-phosphate uridylyltransferase
MNIKIQTALRLGLEAKRVMDLIDMEVHRTRLLAAEQTGKGRAVTDTPWGASAKPYLLEGEQSMNTPDHVAAVLANAEAGGVDGPELAALRRRLQQLADPQAGLLPGEVLEPIADLPRLEQLPEPPPSRARDVLDRLVVVKLNGGLGTSMGLSGPKSLLQVKPGMNFLDVLATQVLALRERYRARLPLVLMNSAATRDASLEVLGGYGGLQVPGVPLDFLQGREPKIRADDWLPARWPADPELEWCPPGHGDIYTALAASGTLDALLHAGLRHAFVSNSDNLGALADVRIAAWLAAEQVPFALEAVRGTAADRKGGHLARYHDRVVLRETAQVPEGDTSFTDVEHWRWYNTNNIWIDLRAEGPAGRRPGRTSPAADRQPQDRQPERPGEYPGDPARIGHGRGDRLDPGRPGDPGPPLAVRLFRDGVLIERPDPVAA